MLANIDGVKETNIFCGQSICGHGSVCWCCTANGGKCFADLATCNSNCHSIKYPRKILPTLN